MSEEKRKGGAWLLRILLIASFVCYSLALLYLLFVMHGSGYGSGMTLGEYIRSCTNFIPFKSISLYIRALGDHSMNMDTPIKNLVGNLLMFLPMGLYLPGFFKRLRKLGAFCICMVALIFVVEATELLLRRGSFDIDDFILNMAGALVGFALWRGIAKARKRRMSDSAAGPETE
jgi:glycopeptide antibiotics resistance protein